LFEDEAAMTQLANTLKLSDVTADEFDAIFYPGGHGPLWDLSQDPLSIGLIQQFWEQEKPVAASLSCTSGIGKCENASG